MSQFRFTALAAALSALGIACGAWAQTGAISPNTGATGSKTTTAADTSSKNSTPGSYSSKASATGSKLDHTDAKFVEKASMGGMAEVELGQLAEQKAQNDQVKQFGARMRQDHGKANDELKQLVSGKNVMMPTAPDKSHQKDMDRLGKLSGAKFDHEYMEHMVKDHKKDIKEFEHEAKHGKDADIKAFAEKTLPTLRDHLQMAQAAESAAKGEKKTAKK